MQDLDKAIRELDRLTVTASRNLWINDANPLIKIIITLLYTVLVVSVPNTDLLKLLSFAVYLVFMFILSDLQLKQCLYRLRFILPVVLLIGISNLFFDKKVIFTYKGFAFTSGFFTFIALTLKGIFCVFASYILVSTTTIDKICKGLRSAHVPKIIVTQIMLVYRYMSVLMEEANKINTAYKLRAPNQKGINYKVWGSFIGLLLLRSMDKAEDIYSSMSIRGYNGEFNYGKQKKITFKDLLFLILTASFFVVFRIYPVFTIIGELFS